MIKVLSIATVIVMCLSSVGFADSFWDVTGTPGSPDGNGNWVDTDLDFGNAAGKEEAVAPTEAEDPGRKAHRLRPVGE